MQHINQLLLLRLRGIGIKQSIRELNLARNTVKKYLARCDEAPSLCRSLLRSAGGLRGFGVDFWLQQHDVRAGADQRKVVIALMANVALTKRRYDLPVHNLKSLP